MQDEAGRMQKRVDELGEDADAAESKAQVTREHSAPDAPGEPLGAAARDATEESGTDEDPEGENEDLDGEDDDGPEGANDDGPHDRE